MALFPQFPYANLHELNLDWLVENISQLMEDGTVISVNGMSGRVTLYTEKDVELPPRAFDSNWSVYRRIADKMAGLQFTGEKFFYITKNVGDEDFTIQEVFTSNNPPPYPVTSVNGRIGTVIIAGDNTPYNMDGVDTIEDVVANIQKAIGPVVQYTSCSVGVTAGQYVYLFMSGISGRTDGIYKAANNKSANTTWTTADLIPVSAGIGGVLANNDNAINILNNNMFISSIGSPPNNTLNNIDLYGSYFGSDSVIEGLPTSNTNRFYQMLCNKKIQFAMRYGANGIESYTVRYYINDRWYNWVDLALSSWVTDQFASKSKVFNTTPYAGGNQNYEITSPVTINDGTNLMVLLKHFGSPGVYDIDLVLLNRSGTNIYYSYIVHNSTANIIATSYTENKIMLTFNTNVYMSAHTIVTQ